MKAKLRGVEMLFITVVFMLNVSAKSDNSFSDKDQSGKSEWREALLIADEYESTGRYIEAYKKYTEVGKMATSVSNFDYASELYIKAITLREKYDLVIPYIYVERNLAYLNLSYPKP